MLRLIKKEKPHKTRPGKIALTLKAHDINVVLDVGGNVGQTGQQLRASGYTGRIVSFEPIPSAHRALVKAAAGDSMWQVPDRVALGAQNGTVTLYESETSDMSSAYAATDPLLTALPRTRVVAEWQTPVTTLEAAIKQHCRAGDRVFVKIDTQGFEKQVLEGIGNAWPQITGLQVEMSLFPLYEGEATFMELCSTILAKGFEPHLMLETTFSRKLNRQLQVDGVFFTKSREA